MAIDKLIPQYLNSDTDQKLVKSVEMTDNLNVRISNDDEGTAGVVKNIKGTTVVAAKTSSDVYPSGDNRVIGSVSNEKNKEVLFLLWNSNQNHGIYRLDMTSGKYQKLYEDSVLNFKKFGYAECDVVINEDEETLLYWTDNENPPMKVNVNRLISSNYPSELYSGTDSQKLIGLTVAKRPPLDPVTFSYKTDESKNVNNLSNKMFQFALQYVYTDGEVTSLSPYSKVAFSTTQILKGIVSEVNDSENNVCVISVPAQNPFVEKVKIIGRIGNTGSPFVIEELDVNGNSFDFDFYNDGIYAFLSADEANKLYDNVPQKAKTLAVTGNRLMYGNYIEGYDNVDLQVDTQTVYHPSSETYSISADINPTIVGDTKQNKAQIAGTVSGMDFNLDFSSLPLIVKEGSFVTFTVQFKASKIVIDDFSGLNASISSIDIDVREEGKATDSISSGTDYIQFPQDPLSVSFERSINADISRADLIDSIIDEITSKEYTTTVSTDISDPLLATNFFGGSPNIKVWFGGVAKYSLFKVSLNSTTSVARLAFSWEGADLYPERVVKTNILGTSIGAELEVVAGGGFNIPSSSFAALSLIMRIGWYDFENSFVSSSIAEDISLSPSLKTSANHEFGIVYYDDRGRSGNVNKIPKVYVAGLSESERKGNKGRAEVDLRLKHTPPSWADKWQLVYTKNTSINEFIQYSVSEAFVASNTDSSETITGNEGDRIYVSFRSLEGKENSYKDGKGANIEYKFEEGDVLSIIKYEDSYTKYPRGFKFRVLGYEYLNDDDDNKLIGSSSRGFRHTGWFLVLSGEEYEGFSYSSVLGNTDLWGQNVVVEISKPKKTASENIYYETGMVYDVASSKHYGDRSIASGGSHTITTEFVNSSGGFFESKTRFYVGDILTLGSIDVIITAIRHKKNDFIAYDFTYKSQTQLTAGSYTSVPIKNFSEAVITFTDGDVYYRPRNIRTNPYDSTDEDYDESSSSSTTYSLEYVEDYSLNDFFSSKNISIGKPNAYVEDAKSIRRRSSITYSDAFVIDSNRLNLSSFNLSLANFLDLELAYGNISSLVPRGDALTVIQENKASQIPIGRNLIEYANGDAGVAVSRKVLGTPSYYAGDFGTSNPESVVERFGVVYYVDSKAGKVIRLSADGITPISEKGLDSFFENKFKSLLSVSKKVRVIGGFDPDNNEYLVTVEPVFNSQLTIGSDVNTITVDADSEFTIQGVTYTSNTVLWNIWGNIWNIFCGDWDDVGNGVVYVDSLFNTQSILVDSVFLGSTATIKVLVTDSSYSFSAIADLNLSNGQITLPSTTCAGDNITISDATEEDAGFTVAYKHKKGIWSSKYSFKPTMYANINNELYSFFDTSSGVMWKHNVNDTRNNFYGTQYDSVIEVVSNRNPSMIKVYEAIGIEGGGTWSGTLTTSDQSTTIGTSDFDTREGHRYAMIYRDTLKSTGHQIYLGKVDSVSTDKVTFTTPINRLPFVVGDILKTASGSTLTGTGMEISGITDRKTIQCTTNITGISAGDNVFVEHTARIEGDAMRDVFLKIKLTSSDTSAFEVHAVSLSYDRSKLHNDRVN